MGKLNGRLGWCSWATLPRAHREGTCQPKSSQISKPGMTHSPAPQPPSEEPLYPAS